MRLGGAILSPSCQPAHQLMRIDRQYFVHLLGLFWVGVGLLLLALVQADGRTEELSIGLILGTMFGQTTVAAAWVALGPGWLWLRTLLSIGWVGLQLLALWIQTNLWPGPDEVVGVMFVSLGLQWLALQACFWGVCWWFGIRLVPLTTHPAELARQHTGYRDQQFGIRQLMIFTALVSVILAAGRAAVAANLHSLLDQGEMGIFLFLVLAAIFMMLPLVFASLLRQKAWLAIGAILVLIALGTATEMPLLRTFSRGPGPNMMHLIWINFFTTLWVLIFTVTVRLCGFRLGKRGHIPIAEAPV